MNSFYIYEYRYREIVDEETEEKVSASVIFCSTEEIDEADLQSEIKTFYEKHYQTDRIFVIGSNKIVNRLIDVFVNQQEVVFKGIPRKQEISLSESIRIYSFNKSGQIQLIHGQADCVAFEKTFLNEGLQQIFISRGGLIVSESAHHYVFPSKKHCDRFLRTGNILLYSAEIYFIAFSLLSHFDESRFSRIYCDTSSINSIAFALFDLKNSFLSTKLRVTIESFSSYEGLYRNPQQYTKDSFLLISASTSTNIIRYLLDLQSTIERDNIVVLYFLAGSSTDINNVKDQVLCNLTQSPSNPNGIPSYPTYFEGSCELCKGGSYAVPVSGDVFLLEAPKINKLLLSRTDRAQNLSRFVSQFKSNKGAETILKSHYKNHDHDKYEIYIDFEQVIQSIRQGTRCKDYRGKLNNYIQQYVPGNTTYILHLMDGGSKALANYVYDYIEPIYNKKSLPDVIDQDHLSSIDEEKEGTVLVVGSCISNGKNLLYISRALRKYRKLRIVYFIGLVRTSDKGYASVLSDNLTMGQYGSGTNSFYAVETIYCSNNSRTSPWIQEVTFLREIIFFLRDKTEYKESLVYFQARKNMLEKASGDECRGLSKKLFYPRVTEVPYEELVLRRGFAFWDFYDYEKDIVQSDVYFTLSNILNSLRHSSDTGRQLKQAVYVRNLLDPANFNRFNDGIIQASLLRSAKADELSYDMDSNVSQQMSNILETIIKYHKQEQGEALMEFLYAIAIKKLTLTVSNLKELIEHLKKGCSEELLRCLTDFIQFKLIDEPEILRTKPLISTKVGGDTVKDEALN